MKKDKNQDQNTRRIELLKTEQKKTRAKFNSDITRKTKDSGQRTTFESGAQREIISGKGRYDLISPFAIKRLAEILERGAIKYSDRNWEKGMPLGKYIDSAMRHLTQHMMGMRDEDHIGQALWNLHAYIHTEECISNGVLPAELDNMTNYMSPNRYTLPLKPRKYPIKLNIKDPK